MRRFLAIACVLVLSAGFAVPSQAQTPTVETSTNGSSVSGAIAVDTTKGYARILFTYDSPRPVASAVADGVLTLRLSQPITTTIDILTEKLDAYISSGRRDPDGLTYRFALKQPVALHNSTEANQTAVDLVPDSYKGIPPDLPPVPPPPKPKAPAPDIETLPVLKIRVGEYSDYTRLVFDWPEPVVYTVYPGQGRVSVRFESLAKPDFSILQARSPAWVKNASWRLDENALVVDLDTDADSAFRDSRDGAKILIDIMAPKSDASVLIPLAAQARPAAPTTPPSPANPQRGSDAVASVKPNVATESQQTTRALVMPPMEGTAAPSSEVTRDSATLRFPAAHGKPVAVFNRGETLWIVLDGHPILDAASLLAPMANIIARASSEQAGGAAVLRLNLKTPYLPSVQEDETTLKIILNKTGTTPAEPINFTRQGADGQTVLATPLPGALHVIQLADLDAGDHFYVVPARAGKAILTPKHFVEMDALASSAGLSIIPLTDDLAVHVQSEVVTISRPKGLTVSVASGANSAVPVVKVPVSKQGPAYVDFNQWSKSDTPDFFKAMRNLRAAISKLPESDGNQARIQLARYLLANTLASEALGEIQLIQGMDGRLAGDPGLLAMRGAAQYMMGRYADARGSLSASAFSADPHAALWRGMAETKLGNFVNARHDLAMTQSVLHLYPEHWQIRARLARAETGLAQGDLASASDALNGLPTKLSARDSVEARLYQAQLLGAQGRLNESIARLKVLEKTDYSPIAAKATFVRVDAEISAKKIKPAEAIAALEQLRFRWRGDELELKTLRKLGELYFAEKNWREGLAILRIAALNFADTDTARTAQDDMQRAFNDLFLGDKANEMRPIDALGLFYDFIGLTPIGSDGDEMIRRLSDRLVAVDLLGPAAELLDHQVKERLQGVARASVATQLAAIYLLDHKPKDALATINESRQTRLPEELTTQRRLLEARALDGLKEFNTALELIADDDSSEAKRLRADIYWNAGNWQIAGAKSEEFLGNRFSTDGPLLPEERALVMRAAVAYSLAGGEAALTNLRMRYAAKMNESPDAKAFAVVTEPIDRQGVAFRDLAKQIASVDSLQAFMADFKKQGAAKPSSN